MTIKTSGRSAPSAGRSALQLAGAAQGTNLDGVLELRNAAGQTLIVADPTDSFGATVATTLATGNYFCYRAIEGDYGSLGQYTITGFGRQGPYPEITCGSNGADLLDGQLLNFGTTLARRACQPHDSRFKTMARRR